MKRATPVSSVIGALFILWGASVVQARSLSDQISLLYGEKGITLSNVVTPGPPDVAHTAHFTSDSLANLGNLVKQFAPSAADFPAISTVPGLTFRYNTQLHVFERSSTSLGPVFVERPQTLGGGKLDFGFSYLYIDFDEFEGNDLDGFQFAGLAHNDCCGTRPNDPSGNFNPTFEEDTADLIFDKFNLRSHVASFFATYGITDRWDVNVLLPVVFTSLRVKARAELNNESGTNTHRFDVGAASGCEAGSIATRCLRSIDDDKTGVGDLQLRTKYQLFDNEAFSIASGLTLRLPTGDEDNFQGIGDPTLTPFLALAQDLGPVNLHANGGVEINFDDSDRSRVRYAVGATVRLIEQIALLVDVIGSSNLRTDRVSTRVPLFTAAETLAGEEVRSKTISTDIVDLNVGFKISPFGTEKPVVGFATVFVPLTDDGLRADAIPAVGLEMGF
ncbi:MAG: transporter [Candidatus Binatia bacterium]